MWNVKAAGWMLCAMVSGYSCAEIADWRTGEPIYGTWPMEVRPGVCLAWRNQPPLELQYADFSNQDAAYANFSFSILDNSRFTGTNLSCANLAYSHLTNADFTDAVITHSNFSASNITAAQFYSTRSYQQKDLRGIAMNSMSLSGGVFTDQNLTGASFMAASLENVTFQGANLQAADFQNASFFTTTNLTGTVINDADFRQSNLSSDHLVSTQSFQDKNLSGTALPASVNFSAMNLSGFNLTGTNLLSVPIAQADFTEAVINGAQLGSESQNFGYLQQNQLASTLSFKQKDLSGTRIVGGDFSGMDFSGFNLTDAGLAGTNLAGADFTDAVIAGCDFSGVQNFLGVQFYATQSYKDKDIHGVKLNDMYLSGGNFSGLNLQGASFEKSDLYRVDFTGSDLTNASFVGSGLVSVTFYDAIIRGADFSFQEPRYDLLPAQSLYSTRSYKEKDLTGVNFSCPSNWLIGNYMSYDLTGQNLTNANFSGQRLSCSFDRAILKNTDFTNATLDWGTSFSDTTAQGFTKEQLYSTRSYQDKTLRVDLSRNDLSGWSFSECRLLGADFSYSNLTGALFDRAIAGGLSSTGGPANFIGANLTGADFTGASVSDSDFTDAIVRYANFSQCNFNGAQLYSTRSYKDRDLRGIILKDQDLAGANFAGQDLTDADFSGTTLFNTDFSGAVITHADFSNTTGRGLTAALFYATYSYQAKDLRGVKLRNNVMPGTDFHEQNLTGADFTGATLTDADFTNAMIQEADFSSAIGFFGVQLYSTRSYKDKDLHGIGLAHHDLTGADFGGMDLTGADFSRANVTNVNLTDAQVTWADFDGTTGLLPDQFRTTQSYKDKNIQGIGLNNRRMTGFDLSGFDLSYTNFSQAVLANVPLQDAQVTGAYFTNTTSSGFTKEQLYTTQNWQQKDLSGIHLNENDLTGWDFSGQNLTGVSFASSLLQEARFDGAVIRDADFSGSTFSGLQVYATQSYQDRDLRGIGLADKSLRGGFFYGQTMTDADFTGSDLYLADFSLADLRGAKGFTPAQSTTCLRSAIRPDGTVNALTLYAAEVLTIRNHSLNIRIQEAMTLAADSTLQVILSDNWGSVMGLENDITPVLAGMLELRLDPEACLEDLLGKSFQLFDWNGTLTDGQQFAGIRTPDGTVWDLSTLYTDGRVTLIPEPATLLLLTAASPLLRRKRKSPI